MVGSAPRASEARGFHPPEVGAMRSAAAANDVLAERAAEADHHVPALAPDHPRREEREGHEASEPAGRQDGNAADVHAGRRGIRASTEHVNLVTTCGEAGRHAPEVRLGAPAAQAPVHHGDAHQGRRPRPSQRARNRYARLPGRRVRASASARRAPSRSPARSRLSASRA